MDVSPAEPAEVNGQDVTMSLCKDNLNDAVRLDVRCEQVRTIDYAGPLATEARMPVGGSALFYNMSHPRRGAAIILDHEEFDRSLNAKRRRGTKVDSRNLSLCLQEFGFEVKVFYDRKFADLKEIVRQAASADHSDCDCFLLAVLTHGGSGTLYAYDTEYVADSLWGMFSADRCPTLAGKPKIFLFQACQGSKLDEGITLRTSTDEGAALSYRIPNQADFLIVHSSVPGYYSWRNSVQGSWFVQALCGQLRQHASTSCDALSLLTLVCHQVATRFESAPEGGGGWGGKKQMPCVVSMLTRFLVLGKKPCK